MPIKNNKQRNHKKENREKQLASLQLVIMMKQAVAAAEPPPAGPGLTFQASFFSNHKISNQIVSIKFTLKVFDRCCLCLKKAQIFRF